MSLPSVAEVLRLPELTAGGPEVLAGARNLENQVRWVHVSELTDISRLLSGGELLLTTGIALDTSERALGEYVDSLATAGVAGLVIEAGRKFGRLPPVLTAAAETSGIPLVLLHREVKFVTVTQEAHAYIIDRQVEELQFRQAIHVAFTEMALEGASVPDIIRYASSMAQRPMVLANRVHQVLHFEPGEERSARLLQEWRVLAQRIPISGGTQFEPGPPGWLLTPIGARGEIWARLALREPDGQPSARAQAILERAAVALALNRLVERDRQTLEVQAQRSLLNDMLSGTHPAATLAARAAALEFPVEGMVLVGGLVRWQDSHESNYGVRAESRIRDLGHRVVGAGEAAQVKVLGGPLPGGSVRILVACRDQGEVKPSLERLASAIHGAAEVGGNPEVVITYGAPVDSIRYARWTLDEAQQVMDSLGDHAPKDFYQLPDVHVRGLLHLLRTDERVMTFWERELQPLIEVDVREESDLLGVLQVFLGHAGNKASTAAELGLSRPTLYARLDRIEHLLGLRLSDVESVLSLHVAMLARQASGSVPAV